MIKLIFTLDYEIYGDGTGDLQLDVFEPTSKLIKIFNEYSFKFVNFVEFAELLKCKEVFGQVSINFIEEQIKEMYETGYEIGMHMHPQWFNAQLYGLSWKLDYTEYNLCTLPYKKINEYIYKGIEYFESIGIKNITSFRAGNWLFLPSYPLSEILLKNGIKVDSSVFKGGKINKYAIDYSKSINNGYYWMFSSDVNVKDEKGGLIEIPIFSNMVSFTKVFNKKKIKLQNKHYKKKYFDYLIKLFTSFQFKYPLKFDFCTLTYEEIKKILTDIIIEDKKSPELLEPIVLIGHSKDLFDFQTVRMFLDFIRNNNINVTTFKEFVNLI